MRDLANNISKGKNLEVNLPKFSQEMMSVYYRYASVRLAMNYYTYNEILTEREQNNETAGKDHLRKLVLSFMYIIENTINNQVVGAELEKAIKSVDDIRNSIIETMKGLTSLVDIFNIYEYVLNRVEYRFKDALHVEVKSDEDFTRDLMRYMLATDDRVVVNANISEAVRQLPMRMTKARFFELLQEGMKVYKDSEKSSVDDFVYMLMSSAMVYTDEQAKNISDDINSIIKDFEGTDFSSLDEDAYNALADKLNYAVGYVQRTVDDYMLLSELINDVYAMLLSAPYADTDCEERDILVQIIQNKDDESVENALVRLEGKQEKLNGMFSNCEYIIDEVLDRYMADAESLMLGAQYHCLKRISILESGSQFVEFGLEVDHSIAGDEYIEAKYNEVVDSLKQFFASHHKLVNRAVMAHVLSSLPVFFNNVEEIQNYVYSSINGCADVAEKTACIEIFATMMEEDGFDIVSQ